MSQTSLVDAIRACDPSDSVQVEKLCRRLTSSIRIHRTGRRRMFDNEFVVAMQSANYQIATHILTNGSAYLAEPHPDLFFDFIESEYYQDGNGFELAGKMCRKMHHDLRDHPRRTDTILRDIFKPYYRLDSNILFGPVNHNRNAYYLHTMRILHTEEEIKLAHTFVGWWLSNLIEFGQSALDESVNPQSLAVKLYEDHLQPTIAKIYMMHQDTRFDSESINKTLRMLCEALTVSKHFVEAVEITLDTYNLQIDPMSVCYAFTTATVITDPEQEPVVNTHTQSHRAYLPPPHLPTNTMMDIDPVLDSGMNQLQTTPTASPVHPVVAEEEQLPWYYRVSDPDEIGVRLEKPVQYRGGLIRGKTKKRLTTVKNRITGRLKMKKNKFRHYTRKC